MGHPDILRGRDFLLYGCVPAPQLDIPAQAIPEEFRGRGFHVHELQFPSYRPHAKSRSDRSSAPVGGRRR